eukprot:GHVN01074851.1.p1 GENE.GHVN01074851.1~~GHVN01074851.1.p1  ORF type:complete len:382 (-),score=73.43 GHVN01074851.1:26-1171(-)
MSILNHVSVNARLAAIRVQHAHSTHLLDLHFSSNLSSIHHTQVRLTCLAPSLRSPPHLAYSANPSISLIHTGTPLTPHSLSTRRSFFGSAVRGVVNMVSSGSRDRDERRDSRYRFPCYSRVIQEIKRLHNENDTSEVRSRKRDDDNEPNGKQTDITKRLHKRLHKSLFEFMNITLKELKVPESTAPEIFDAEVTDLLLSNMGSLAATRVLNRITEEDLEIFFLGEEMMNEASEELVDEMCEAVHSLLMEAILHERDEFKRSDFPIEKSDHYQILSSAENLFNTKVKNTVIFFINEKTTHAPDTTHTPDSTDTPHTSSVTSIDWRAEMKHFIGTTGKTFGTYRTNKRDQTRSDDDDDEVDEVSERFQASLKKFFQYLSRSSR